MMVNKRGQSKQYVDGLFRNLEQELNANITPRRQSEARIAAISLE